MFRIGHRWSAGAGAILMIVVSGCGTSAYNDLVKDRVAQLRAEVKFQGMYASSQIPSSQLKLRIPMIMSNSYSTASGHPDDGTKINPARLQPPFLNLPGLKLTYETRHKTADGTRLPFYCYIASTPGKPGDADRLCADFQKRLKQRFPDTPDTWEAVDADSPTGFAVHWRKLRVVGEQPFFVKGGGMVEARNMPGVFELWVHEGDGQIVILGWRSPQSIDGPDETKFVTLNNVTLPPDNPKPDLTKWPVLTAGSLVIAEAAATP